MAAKIRQFLKATEASVREGDSWQPAWLYTGLPDPRPSALTRTGLAHPAEHAATISYMREVHTLEEHRKKMKGKGKGDDPPADADDGPRRRRKGGKGEND